MVKKCIYISFFLLFSLILFPETILETNEFILTSENRGLNEEDKHHYNPFNDFDENMSEEDYKKAFIDAIP